jgi:hypothetical protein
MEIKKFIENYREAFGETAELPIVFWYSDTPESQTEKINGCFFKNMNLFVTVLITNPLSLASSPNL